MLRYDARYLHVRPIMFSYYNLNGNNLIKVVGRPLQKNEDELSADRRVLRDHCKAADYSVMARRELASQNESRNVVACHSCSQQPLWTTSIRTIDRTGRASQECSIAVSRYDYEGL
jgi:hypothetical protein